MLEPKCFYKFLRFCQILILTPLICDPTLFPGKSSPNIAKSNRVFPERREEIEP